MNENIINEDFLDPIGDLRRALNTETITKEKFLKLSNVLKVMPELFVMAKKND